MEKEPANKEQEKAPKDALYTKEDAFSFLSEEPQLDSVVDVMKHFS